MLFTQITREDFARVQPGDFDPDLDMVDEMAALELMCSQQLGLPFDKCSYVDAATYDDGSDNKDPKTVEINGLYAQCAASQMGSKLTGFGARYNYFLVEDDGTKYLFCRWDYDSVFVVSNIDTPEA